MKLSLLSGKTSKQINTGVTSISQTIPWIQQTTEHDSESDITFF